MKIYLGGDMSEEIYQMVEENGRWIAMFALHDLIVDMGSVKSAFDPDNLTDYERKTLEVLSTREGRSELETTEVVTIDADSNHKAWFLIEKVSGRARLMRMMI